MKAKIQNLNLDGFGVAKIDNKEILVPCALPGDEIEIQNIKKKKKKFIAESFKIIKPSPKRQSPKCPYFGICGGCLFQNLAYQDQLLFKKAKLRELLKREIEVIPSPKQYGYRTRIDIVITPQGIGFRKRGSWHEVVNIKKCFLFGPASQKAIEGLDVLIQKEKIKPWDLKEHTGNLRYMVLREGKFTNQIMVNLIFKRAPQNLDLEKYFPFASSIYLSVNETLSDVSFGKPFRHWRDEFLKEKLLGIEYFIHPNSFFQSNSYQAENLLKIIEKFVEGKKVLDLYCGVGTFSIFLAKKGYTVDAVEVVPESVRMAKLNAMVNEVFVNFQERRAEYIDYLKYDTIIVDPPRSGLHPKLIKKLNKEKIKNLIYVSCKIKTLIRDLSQLQNYQIKEIIGLDMFPQTPEIETVVVLRAK